MEFKQCVPASGSTISSFNFELEFDIEKALEAAAQSNPGVNVGMGYTGGAESSSSAGNATLYKGDEISGEIIGTSLNANFTGKADGFVVNGNKVKMIFDESIPIIANQEYTIKITNKFYLYKENSAVFISATKHDFHNDPIILKFYGADLGDSKIFVERSNVENGSSVDKLDNVVFNLSAPFTINPGAEVLIKEGDNVIARTSELKASPADEKNLIADFDNKAILYLGHNYTVILPAGSVSLASNSNATNLEYSVDVKGLSNFVIKLASSKVEKDDKGIPVSITFIYELPEGTILSEMTSFSEDAIGHMIYNGVNSRFRGSFVENGKGLKWTFRKDYWSPDTEYTFCKEANSIYVCDASGNYLPEFINEVDEVSFTTPSFDAWGYPPMEFTAPSIYTEYGVEVPYTDGMKVDNLYSITFWLKDKFYTLDKNRYYLSVNPLLAEDQHLVYFYEVTPDGDKFVLSQRLTHVMDMNVTAQYGYTSLNIPLYEGKKYKLVIPKGSFTVLPVGDVTDKSKCNLIKNEEIVLAFEGTTPSKCILESCSIPDNSTVSNLYTVCWVFAGNYRLNDKNSAVKCLKTIPSDFGELPFNTEMPAYVSTLQGKTYVYVDFIGRTTGQPTVVNNNTTYVLTIPKGMLINTVNDEIVNDEIVLTFKGGEEETEPETVWVNMTINGMHTTAHPAVKGKSYTFSLNPGTDWKIKSVKNGSTSLAGIASDPKNPQMKTFVMTALKGDTNVDAELEYDGQWATEDTTTKVWTIEANNIRIYCDNNMIVVDGVTPENTINVYNVAGMFINTTHVSYGNDRVYISVPLNQTYFVSVDGVAAKIYVK